MLKWIFFMRPTKTTHAFTSSYSQEPRLVLSKLGNKNKITFFEGDEIYLKVGDGDNYIGGLIIGLRDSVIHFRYFDIPVKEISEVNIDGISFGGFNVGQYGPLLMIAGPAYVGLDLLNQGNITNRTIVQAAAISGIGYILWKMRRKKFKIKKRNKIYIVRI